HDRQVHGHRGGRAGRRDQPLRDGRGEGAAEDRADGVGDRDPGEADAGGEELGVHRRLLAVGEAEADGEDDQSQQKQSQAAGVDQREQGEDADEQEDPAEQIGVLAPDPVRDGAGEDREDQPGDRRGGHGPQHGAALEADGSGRVRGVVLDVAAGGHVSGGIVAHEYQRGEDDEQPVAAQQLAQRVRHLLLAFGDLMEDRRLLDAAADPVADEDEHDGQEEGHPPRPYDEASDRGDRGNQRQDSRGQEEADRDADLREGPAQPAGPLIGMLDREQDRSAPFAAGRDSLDDAQDDEQDRGDDAGRLIGRQEADEGGGRAHGDEGDDEHDPAAEPVAVVAGEEGAQRAEEEADPDRRERDHGRQRRTEGAEEEFVEDQS